MVGARTDMVARVDALRRTCDQAADRFLAAHEQQIEAYRQQISLGIDDALAGMRADMAHLSVGNEIVRELGEQAAEYVSWMQWSLWDLPVLAVALRPEPDEFRRSAAACGLVYIAIRVFDDVIDQHYSYKGRHETLLASTTRIYPNTRKAAGLNTLAGLLLCFEGLGRLSDPGQEAPAATVQAVVASVRRAVIGAIMEYTELHAWTPSDYDRLVQLKNVDYWRGLYAALDPNHTSPLYPFLQRYYELAQYLNDIRDYEEDLRWGQPNLVAVHQIAGSSKPVASQAIDDVLPWAVSEEVERLVADRFLALGNLTPELPEREQAVAEYQLSQSLATAYDLGLFAPVVPEAPPQVPSPRPNLFWYSELADVIDHAGTQALVHVDCGVCGSKRRRSLFQKQGFSYHRCTACSHIYVSPRVSSQVQTRMLLQLDDHTPQDRYLEVQRVYAEYICHLLRLQAPGPRLLDIGFGRGYLMLMAQVYGFEVYGLDSSHLAVDRLRPQFGHHVVQRVIGGESLPWDCLDAVVMSHVLEHLPDPGGVLATVADHMNPGAVLYLAVPDIESTHFKIFGKRWDAISPLVHLQYFNERSLRRLLEERGFEGIERIEHPRVREDVAPRWVRLLRHLGGSDANDLAMLARLPT